MIPHPNNRLARLLALTLALGLALPAGVTVASAKTAFRVEETTISEIQRAILAKELTSTELVHLYLARIKAYNGPAVEYPEGLLGPIVPIENAKGINALLTLNLRPAARKAWGFDERKARSMTDAVDADPGMPDALETAAALDAHFARTGKLVGPLHGVVFSIKDQYDTFDLRTTSGADAAYANDRPPADAEFVARLRAAGAIILAKANMGEYAGGYRSSFGGVLVNPYDTTRVPGGSSGGSGTSVAANLVTVSIGEETGPSIRAPAHLNNTVGISPTQELVSRHGMINQGFNTRTGPVARTVEDAARVLTVIAGHDPKDEMTVFAIGRTPGVPYESFTRGKTSLKGLRIGVVREYLDKSVFGKQHHANIDLIEKAIADLRALGATIVEPGPEGLFTPFIRRYNPMLSNAAWTKRHPDLFPFDEDGKPVGDHLMTLIGLAGDPSKVPGKLTIRDFPPAGADGESKYGYNLYLRRRGDAKIRKVEDLANFASFYDAPFFATKKTGLLNTAKAPVYSTAERLQRRFAVQQIVLAAMAELELDALVSPTGISPARKLVGPVDPNIDGLSNYGMFNFIGAQGFPNITVPAGFVTQVYDRVPDPDAPVPAAAPASGASPSGDGEGGGGRTPSKLVGPFPVRLPGGVDFIGRPFDEPVLLAIAAAYEQATRHRSPPPSFGPLP